MCPGELPCSFPAAARPARFARYPPVASAPARMLICPCHHRLCVRSPCKNNIEGVLLADSNDYYHALLLATGVSKPIYSSGERAGSCRAAALEAAPAPSSGLLLLAAPGTRPLHPPAPQQGSLHRP